MGVPLAEALKTPAAIMAPTRWENGVVEEANWLGNVVPAGAGVAQLGPKEHKIISEPGDELRPNQKSERDTGLSRM
jgi:hypothetical protein